MEKDSVIVAIKKTNTERENGFFIHLITNSNHIWDAKVLYHKYISTFILYYMVLVPIEVYKVAIDSLWNRLLKDV
jgi:hypothetical protein